MAFSLMKNNADLLAVVEILQNDEFLREIISVAPPQAIVMPFAKDTEKKYIFIAVFFEESSLRKMLIFRTFKRIIDILKSDHMDRLDGLEILISTVSGDRTERVVRLSVLAEAFDHFEAMSDLEFGNRTPAAGITCLVYKQFE